MSGVNLDWEVGKLKADSKAHKEELDEVKANLKSIKEDVQEIKDALTKGKGVFIGLIIASSSAGAIIHKWISTWEIFK